ncbi:MAG: hypothetical protein ABSF91_08605 [Bacteroidota bacterium]|jgi:hypothetical protein
MQNVLPFIEWLKLQLKVMVNNLDAANVSGMNLPMRKVESVCPYNLLI